MMIVMVVMVTCSDGEIVMKNITTITNYHHQFYEMYKLLQSFTDLHFQLIPVYMHIYIHYSGL